MFEIFNTIFKYKEKESPDKLGLFPELVHIDAMPERRYLWTSRFLVIFACFSICLNMMLASSLYIMLPQRSSSPLFFYIDRYFNTVEQVQPMEIDYPVGNLINEEQITTYIMMRYLISDDYDELIRRWGPGSYIYWMSSPSIYGFFQSYDAKFNMTQFRQNNMVRNVEIDWIRPLARGLWQTQFRTMDYTEDSPEPITNIWRAAMRISFMSMPSRSHEDALKNPYSFVITQYALSYKGEDTAAEHYMSRAKRISTELFFR